LELSRRSFIKATCAGLGALIIPLDIIPSPRPFLMVGDKITIGDCNKVFTVTEIYDGRAELKRE